MTKRALAAVAAFAVAGSVAAASAALAADCAATSTGLIPLADLGNGSYKGESGGLYGGGSNEPPRAYAEAGLSAARGVARVGATGDPDPAGKVVLLSIGMSNTTQEFSTFVRIAGSDDRRDDAVVIVDGAQGGQDARVWANAGARTWTVVDDRLRAAGATREQV